MTTNNILKLKDGRIWKAKHTPIPEGKPLVTFEDVTLEIANIIRDTMSADVQGVFKPKPEQAMSYLE